MRDVMTWRHSDVMTTNHWCALCGSRPPIGCNTVTARCTSLLIPHDTCGRQRTHTVQEPRNAGSKCKIMHRNHKMCSSEGAVGGSPKLAV
ncbi:hypothetical protein E2C01_061693 [Portunus trituberculatus]|uniref:Uncharacterized protein n=1 Tax=Portunus trituberculatus TaxID=210409 RepID=A0A5B7HBX5_PORTR|nr:hypothetical protein [Portunus trituberculatus]